MLVIKYLIISLVLNNLIVGVLSRFATPSWVFKFSLPFICPKCFGFWFTLIGTGSLYYASIVALIYMVMESLKSQQNDETEA